MTRIYAPATAWDAQSTERRTEGLRAVRSGVTLGEPAEQVGNFIDDEFIFDETGVRWYVWDDPRISLDHALAVIATIQGGL